MCSQSIRLGIIGYGYRIRHIVSVLGKIADIKVTAICDTNLEAARANAANAGCDMEHLGFFDSADRMLDSSRFDGIVIGTRCSSHTPMALKVLQRKLPLYLEKPVAIDDGQLEMLLTAARKKEHKVVVSFPLRLTPWVTAVKKLIADGAIGKIEHVQAVNNVPYGHVYFQSWYRDNAETGGLFLQKATHDFDYINFLLGVQPMSIAAMTSKNVYTGSHKPGLFCKNCDENRACKESVYNSEFVPCEGEWMQPEIYMCAFAPDAANEDCGSALIRYENDVHAVYSQNFFSKHKAGKRGARLIGYDGTIEFDWYSDQITLFQHHKPKVETISIDNTLSDGHGGGDQQLCRNFIDMIVSSAESRSTLEEGILSAAMCLAAQRSAQTSTFQTIPRIM
jgi:predicted dehydrogenase